jgi:stearoyl-CoA desaturase (delta-9 desaturase)
LLDLPWWGYVAVTLAATHLTILGVTIYLHRCQAHRALDLHPALAHVFRFWLWLTTGMETRQWIAVHRKHHARVETAEDPHSPQVYGIRKLLLEGAELYRVAIKDRELVEKYGHGAQDDWLERNVYARHSDKGFVLLLAIDAIAFGPIGLTIWAVQMLWIPVLAAGVINGVGHWRGYRNFETADSSTNIVPIGVLIGGEELHNNHHAFASSAKFSVKWWELDIGWLYIRLLAALRLARVKKVAPTPVMVAGKVFSDDDTVTAIITNRFQVMARYARTVLARVHAEEVARVGSSNGGATALRAARRLLVREETLLSGEARARLDKVLDESPALDTVYRFKQRLQGLWTERHASQERLLQSLDQWCREAEATGIRALQEFARTLPTYSMCSA